MGDMADYYADLALSEELKLEQKARKIRELYEQEKLIWTTRNGRQILINDMASSHIKNTINYLRKHYDYPDPCISTLIDIFNLELTKRARSSKDSV